MPKYTRNTGKPWIPSDVKQLRWEGLKPRFDPEPNSEGISLKPTKPIALQQAQEVEVRSSRCSY